MPELIVPLWDRIFIPTKDYILNRFDFEHGNWLNIYLIPDEIYEKIKLNELVSSIQPEQIYVTEANYYNSFSFETNFHFVSIKTFNYPIQIIEGVSFSTDVHDRVGIVQTLLYAPLLFDNNEYFQIQSNSIVWDDNEEHNKHKAITLSILFSHYLKNSFSPYLHNAIILDETLNLNVFRNPYLAFNALSFENFEDKNKAIVNYTFALEIERLHKIEFYENLILKINYI